ncbi:ABC transporter ATP-binding protein [Aquitalea aquatica]|uniref:ABC transporter ATP-binding protein n=1 Tax=Aquitalea aquatica TaxID=3044273 RepID=A0A838Y0H8_9NEIS|nr:ABC transporter ATP-binding protein [Aquitalea magnusonii]MBA4708156.1 ABC transporter ATP-binding protein [Aquitalea magnusonii]
MHIFFKDVTVRFPIYDAKQRSFRQTLLSAATGGNINHDSKITMVESLKGINLDIRKGDRVALIGHNGSGKTTLLRVMAGVYKPDIGHVDIQGKVTSLLDSQLGMDPEATGFENMRLRGLFLGLKPNQIEGKIDEIAEFSELGDFLNMPVRTYSSGMVLRLAFAISTCIQPEILLMDEWISVGDESFKHKAEKRLHEFVDNAGILIFASHDHELTNRVCNKKIHLEHGKIINIE